MPAHPLRAAATAAVLLTALVPAGARAAAYTVRPCGPASPAPFAGSELLSGDSNTTVDNRCTTSGGFRMSFVNPTNQTVAGSGDGFRLRIPTAFPHAKILQLSANITIAPRSGNAVTLLTIDETNGGDNPAGVQGTWNPGGQVGPFDVFQAPTSPTRSVLWRLSSNGASYNTTGLGAAFVLNGMSLDLDDSTLPLAPTMTQTGLLDGTPQSGKRILTMTATDEDSGVHDVVLRSGSTQLVDAFAGTGCTYVSVEACPTTRSGDIVVDTTKLPDGPQVLLLFTIDAANNTRVMTTPPFTVANQPTTPGGGAGGATPPPIGPVNGDPKGVPIVTAGTKATKASKNAESKTVSWHAPVTITGRLLAADGSPMAGAQLDITQTVGLKGATTTKLASTTTDAKGVYRYKLTATSSGTIAVQYPKHVDTQDYSAARAIKLAVRAHVTLARKGTPKRNAKITFTGHVDVSPMPAGGVPVSIQYHSRTGDWLRAEVVTTNAAGDFRWVHTFRRPAKFRLRAHVNSSKTVAAATNNSPELRFRIR